MRQDVKWHLIGDLKEDHRHLLKGRLQSQLWTVVSPMQETQLKCRLGATQEFLRRWSAWKQWRQGAEEGSGEDRAQMEGRG